MLRRGQKSVAGFSIDPRDMLPPGEYEIQVTYFAKSKSLVQNAEENLVSNPVRIKITD